VRNRWWVVGAVVSLAGCAVDMDDSLATTTTIGAEPNGVVVEVLAIDNTFRPETLSVEAGTEVVFVNNGRNAHDVRPADGSDGWGVAADGFEPGDRYSLVFGAPGTYAYYCSIHGTATAGMLGTIEVTAP